MLTISKNTFLKIFIYVFLFLYIYSPRWIRGFDFITNSYYWGWACFLIFSNKIYKMFLEKKINSDKIYSKYIFLIVCSALYYLIIHLLMGKNVNIVSARIFQNLYPIVSLLNLTVICNYMQKMNYSKLDGVCTILNLAIFQGIICVFMLVIPSLKSYANYLFLNTSSFREGDYILSTRIYGITSDYTYAFPIIHGILCGISLYIGLNYKRKYVYLSLLILISVFLNGRTGLLIAIFSSAFSFWASIKSKKTSFRTILSVSFISSIVYLLFRVFEKHISTVVRFAMGLFQQLSDRTGNIEYLFNTHLFFPKGFSFIFGEGHSVYGSNASVYGYLASDVGFVNDLFIGGLIYLAFRYTPVFMLINYKSNNKTKLDEIISFTLLVAWIISCIKGQSTANPMIIACVQYLFVVRYMLEMREENAV